MDSAFEERKLEHRKRQELRGVKLPIITTATIKGRVGSTLSDARVAE
jgi:hypothetical protein